MKQYEYRVYDDHNNAIAGKIWAESKEEVKIKLKLEGYIIGRISETQKKTSKWSHKSVARMSHQLGLLLQSGIPLRRSLLLLKTGHSDIPFSALYESIQRGQSLSTALKETGFPSIGIALLEAGEEAGTLGESLQYIANYYEQEMQCRQKIISAISYPAFLLVLMNVFFLVTILFIIPSFSRVFATMHIELPWMTRGLFALGEALREHPVMCICFSVGIITLLIVGYHQKCIKIRIHKWLWQMATKHAILMALYYTNILKVWALLLQSGISIVHIMELTRDIWRNLYGTSCSDRVVPLLKSGHSFCESLSSSSIGNEFLWQMIGIGEESGELVAMLEHCHEYYQSLLNHYIARLERLMEPILLAVMGIGIGVLVVSVMYPLFTSLSSLSGQ